jgi:prephenate dehydrogenase
MGRVTDPPFGRIAVLGLGLIGGSIALAARRRWPAVSVVAIDRMPVVDAAVRMKVADGGGESPALARDADLVILAAPVLQNVTALASIAEHVGHDAVVTDVGSTKRVMEDAAASLPARLQFVGGHPLAGAAVSGVEAARPDLFDDRPWILTGTSRASASTVEALTRFISGLRAVPQYMEAAEHDRLLAYLSHLPQLAVSALMHVVGDRTGEDGLALAGRGLRDTTRLATSPGPTWRDIVATNGDNIACAIDDLIAALQQLRPDAPGDAPAGLEGMFRSAARWKGVLEHG